MLIEFMRQAERRAIASIVVIKCRRLVVYFGVITSGEMVRKFLLILAGLSLYSIDIVCADQRLPVLTKYETFQSRAGAIVVRTSSQGGYIVGSGTVNVEASEARDASDPKSRATGIVIEVSQTNGVAKQAISVVDSDEITGLLQALDYMSKLAGDIPPGKRLEVEYRTRGDLSILIRSEDVGGSLKLSVTAGRIVRAVAFLEFTDLPKLKTAVVDAAKFIQ